MSGASWTHLMARPLVRPLIGTRVRPNHLTTLRLLTGLAACALLAGGAVANAAPTRMGLSQPSQASGPMR